ncbi:MAG: hypothetical protein U0V18_13430 [Anaerolineales bacterium]
MISNQENSQTIRKSTKFAGILLILLYLAFCIAISLLISQQVSKNKLPAETLTPTPVRTPEILGPQPEHEWQIQYEDFSKNTREWTLLYNHGKLELIDEKMILQSYQFDRGVIGTTYSIYNDFEPTTEEYFVQADFTTDRESLFGYGLVFGLDRSLGTFYLFEIQQQTQAVTLRKYVADNWVELFSTSQNQVNPYPTENTLSVHFAMGEIGLYLNGNLITTYDDENPFNSKGVGAFISSSGIRLIVDNFFTYDK